VNKAELTQVWDNFRMAHGIGIRAIELLPADKLDAHPIPFMRTPKQLVCHMYQIPPALTAAVAKGEAVDSTPAEEKAAASIQTRDELVAWCKKNWADAEKTFAGLTDAQVKGTVKTPWGHDFTGHGMIDILVNEYWHHRGQLYTYLRALGVAPHSLYDFEHNAPEFQGAPSAT